LDLAGKGLCAEAIARLTNLELQYVPGSCEQDAGQNNTKMFIFLSGKETAVGARCTEIPQQASASFWHWGKDLPYNFFSLSDHIDMLGDTLMATHTATRKANGDELQEKIKNVVGTWKAGRFMPLTMRTYSLNC
jgi:hypothetical protein